MQNEFIKLQPDAIWFLESQGIKIKKFTEYHFRACDVVDIYPTTRTVMKVGGGKSYKYQDKYELLACVEEMAELKPKKEEKKVVDNTEKILFLLRFLIVTHITAIILYLFFI